MTESERINELEERLAELEKKISVPTSRGINVGTFASGYDGGIYGYS